MKRHSPSHWILAPVVAAAFGLLAGTAPAQQATAPATPPATGTPAQAPAPAPPPARDAADPDKLPPAPASSKPTPQRFEPTEKVRPDFDVAFPVDI